MALPSSRRPPEVEEELLQVTEQIKKESLKIRVNLNKVFMETMSDWYHCKLKPSNRSRLRRKDIIIKAQNVTSRLNMRYDRLPKTWLKQLHDEYNVDFIWQHPAEKAKRRAIRRLKKAAIMGKLSLDEMKRKIEDLNAGVLTPAAVEPNVSENEDSTPGPKTSELFRGEFESKLVDLSDEPPPDFWIAAYIKGIHLPRVLKLFNDYDKGQTIIYYDYNETDLKVSFNLYCSKDAIGEPLGIFKVHESNNFMSWRN